MDSKSTAAIPWFSAVCTQFQQTREQGRLPHAVLILARDGLGAGQLARWMGDATLCESAAGPCGTCPSCVLLRAENHPDLHLVKREKKTNGVMARDVTVEQVRELIEAMQQTSYRGGWKVGIVFEAHCLNLNGANAFLKTLEEPPPGTLLILVSGPNHRLPATISSRCQRVVIPVPERSVGVEWLATKGIGMPDAGQRLALAQGAPFTARDFATDTVPRVEQEMSDDLARMAASRLDPSLTAERWLKTDFPLRLMWLENWITDRIRAMSAPDPAGLKSVDAVGLSGSLLKAKIRTQFRFLDEVRDLKGLPDGINMQLALEGVLMRQFFKDH